MSIDYLISLGLYLFGLVIRLIYEHCKKICWVNTKNILVFGLVFLAMCLLWAGWFSRGPLASWPLALPNIVRWIEFGFVLLGMGLSIGTFIQLKGVENISRLVTTGLFSRIRHPMYNGFILWIVGWVIYHGALVSLFFGVCGHRQHPVLATAGEKGIGVALQRSLSGISQWNLVLIIILIRLREKRKLCICMVR